MSAIHYSQMLCQLSYGEANRLGLLSLMLLRGHPSYIPGAFICVTSYVLVECGVGPRRPAHVVCTLHNAHGAYRGRT